MRRRDKKFSYPCVSDANVVLDVMNVDEYSLYFDFLLLCIIFVFLRFLGYFILRWRIRGRH